MNIYDKTGANRSATTQDVTQVARFVAGENITKGRQLWADYDGKVYEGVTGLKINPGTKYITTVAGGYGYAQLVVWLTDSLIVGAWWTNNDKLSAQAGSVSGSAVTLGTVLQIDSAATTIIAMIRLSDSTFAVLYKGASSYINIKVCSVSGTTITAGSVWNPSYTVSIPGDVEYRHGHKLFKRLDDTHFVFACNNGGSTNFRTTVFSVSGTTITAGTAHDNTCASAWNGLCELAVLDSTHFVIAYQNNSNVLKVRCCSVSGTTITGGTEVTLYNGAIPAVHLLPVTSTSFIAVYGVNGVSYFRAVAGSVSGTTITLGTEVNPINNGLTYYPNCGDEVRRIGSSNVFVITYSRCYYSTVSVSGTTVTPIILSCPYSEFANGMTSAFQDLLPLSDTLLLVMGAPTTNLYFHSFTYLDGTGRKRYPVQTYGTYLSTSYNTWVGIAMNPSGTKVALMTCYSTGLEAKRYLQSSINICDIVYGGAILVGVALESVSANDTVNVAQNATWLQLSDSLSPGSDYAYDVDGTPSTSWHPYHNGGNYGTSLSIGGTSNVIGKAFSTSRMQVSTGQSPSTKLYT